MKNTYYTAVLFIFFVSSLWSQNVETKVVFNNTGDIKEYKNVIAELKSAVNNNDLRNALSANGNITDKNLKLDIVFFDRNHVGNMKLKRSHILTVDGYKEKWRTGTENSTAVLFLFVKEQGKNEYEFKGLSVSKRLENEHLFEKVIEFINEYLSGNHKTVIANGSKYLARAITPVWTEEKRNAAKLMLDMKKYYRQHFNFFFNPELLDLAATRQAIDTNYVRVYFMKKTTVNKKDIIDTLKTTLPVYLDRRIFPTGVITLKDEIDMIQTDFVLSFLKKKEEVVALLECNEAFYKFIESMEQLKKVKDIPVMMNYSHVSTWGWNEDYTLSHPENLIDLTSDYKFIVTKKKAKEIFNDGDPKPPWIDGYNDTYCNVFAYDLSRNILFPNYSPWGSSHCANKLHWRIFHNENFKNVPLSNENKLQKDAWAYTQVGYVVYFTAFGKNISDNLLQTVTDEKSIDCKPAGHIATCFESSTNEVIQAGAEVRILKWNGTQAHIYLGYIIKD